MTGTTLHELIHAARIFVAYLPVIIAGITAAGIFGAAIGLEIIFLFLA
jgi:hypothetical protein